MSTILLVGAFAGVFFVGYFLGFTAGRSSGKVDAFEQWGGEQ